MFIADVFSTTMLALEVGTTGRQTRVERHNIKLAGNSFSICTSWLHESRIIELRVVMQINV